MRQDLILQKAVDHLVTTHGCHTVILYGSRARGTETEASDYDLMGFRSAGSAVRDARFLDGVYLDAFVYSDTALQTPAEFLHVRGGRVMVQRGNLGDCFLAAVAQAHRAGPTPWPEDECSANRVWASKMLQRIARGDAEGLYRRAWLMMQLIEDYFKGRGLWYEGPKASFAWLAEHDPETLAAYERALAPGAGLAEAEALVQRVWPAESPLLPSLDGRGRG